MGFNFDVESDRTIVCSELAYVVYGDPRWGWPTDTVLSRATISPDHVAEKAHSVRGRSGGEASFEAVLLYHDGHECTVSQVQRGFDLLIDGRASDLSCK